MQTITIPGVPPSKKNSKRIVRNRRTGRSMLVSQVGYDLWELSCANLFRASLRPVERAAVLVELHFADRRRRDLTNAVEGIMDALVRSGVLRDDCWAVVPELTIRGFAAEVAQTRITIEAKK